MIEVDADNGDDQIQRVDYLCRKETLGSRRLNVSDFKTFFRFYRSQWLLFQVVSVRMKFRPRVWVHKMDVPSIVIHYQHSLTFTWDLLSRGMNVLPWITMKVFRWSRLIFWPSKTYYTSSSWSLRVTGLGYRYRYDDISVDVLDSVTKYPRVQHPFGEIQEIFPRPTPGLPSFPFKYRCYLQLGQVPV